MTIETIKEQAKLLGITDVSKSLQIVNECGLKELNNMQIILKCPNGKQINMTSYAIQQMAGEITRAEVEERIEFYKTTNTK
jgi:hypothetical protein